MTRRRKRPNFFALIVLALVLLFGYYFNQVYLPTQPNPFEATPTATRSAEGLAVEAEELFKQGKLLQAIDSYQAAINASPQNPALYIAMARIQVWAGKYEEAQANSENAILLNPENSMAHAVRAWALDFQRKNSDAMTEIDKALEFDPNNAIAHAYRVEILIDSGTFANIEKAIEVSNTAIALDPNAIETRRARAYLLEVTANYEEAIQFYRSAIELNSNIPILHMELGRNLRIMQVYDDAITEFTYANTLNPSDPEPDLYISRTYATVGDYAKALQYAKEAVKDRPTDPSLRGNYGVMFYYNFFYTEAVEQLSLATSGGETEDGFPIKGLPLANDLRVVEYYYTYGQSLARTNQCGKALKVAQDIQTNIHMDEISMQTVDIGAGKIIEICQQNLDNPVNTPAVTPSEGTAVEAPSATEPATAAPVETSAP